MFWGEGEEGRIWCVQVQATWEGDQRKADYLETNLQEMFGSVILNVLNVFFLLYSTT